MDYGYARVSTTNQDLMRQLDILEDHGVSPDKIFEDKRTGRSMERRGITRLLATVGPGDVVVATTLDRIGRNLRECLNLVHDLRERGVGLRTLKDPIPIDTSQTGAMAEMAVALLALFAEMERVFMLERAATARAAREARGIPAGPKPKLDAEDKTDIAETFNRNVPVDRIAKRYRVSRATIYRALADAAAARRADKVETD